MNLTIIRQKAADRRSLLREIDEKAAECVEKKEKHQTLINVQTAMQEAIKEIQGKLSVSLTAINQQALDITFPGYEYSMEFTTKNNVSFAGIYVMNNGRRQKPMDGNGGGLGNILAICSQMAAKKMMGTRDVIIADQPMGDLSQGNKEDLAMEMLKTIAADMGLQYIMISHSTSQINTADRTLEFTIKDDPEKGYPVSQVKISENNQ